MEYSIEHMEKLTDGPLSVEQMVWCVLCEFSLFPFSIDKASNKLLGFILFNLFIE